MENGAHDRAKGLTLKRHLPRLAIDVVLQSLPFKQLHRKEWPALMLANFINSADIRVIDGRRGARFTLEAFQSDSVMRDVFGQKLQRYFTAETQVFGAIHNSHAPAAEL